MSLTLTEKQLDDLEWALKFMSDYERKHKIKGLAPKLKQIRDNLERDYPEAFTASKRQEIP